MSSLLMTLLHLLSNFEYIIFEKYGNKQISVVHNKKRQLHNSALLLPIFSFLYHLLWRFPFIIFLLME